MSGRKRKYFTVQVEQIVSAKNKGDAMAIARNPNSKKIDADVLSMHTSVDRITADDARDLTEQYLVQ